MLNYCAKGNKLPWACSSEHLVLLLPCVSNAFSWSAPLDCGRLSVLQQDTSEMARLVFFSWMRLYERTTGRNLILGQPARHVSNCATHQGDFKTTPPSPLCPAMKDFYSDLDETRLVLVSVYFAVWLKRAREDPGGQPFPTPPSLPQTLADTLQGSHFSPSPLGLWQVWERLCLRGRRLAGLTPLYSPGNYGHLLGRPSLGAFQGPWLLP